MVPDKGLRPASLDEALNPVNDRWAVRAPIHQIAQEDETAPLGMVATCRVTESVQQRLKGVDLAVDVPDNVERAINQGLDEIHTDAFQTGSGTGHRRSRTPATPPSRAAGASVLLYTMGRRQRNNPQSRAPGKGAGNRPFRSVLDRESHIGHSEE